MKKRSQVLKILNFLERLDCILHLSSNHNIRYQNCADEEQDEHLPEAQAGAEEASDKPPRDEDHAQCVTKAKEVEPGEDTLRAAEAIEAPSEVEEIPRRHLSVPELGKLEGILGLRHISTTR